MIEERYKNIDGVIYKQCFTCKEFFEMNLDNFYNAKTSDGYHSYCKECARKNSMKNYDPKRHTERTNYYYHNNEYRRNKKLEYARKDREAGKYRAWQQSEAGKQYNREYNRQRMLHKKHEVTEEQWIMCKEYFYNCCVFCGLPLKDHYKKFKGELLKYDFSKDHADDEGSNDISNCIPACHKCNSSKFNHELERWYRKQSFFSEQRLEKIYQWLNGDYKITLK